MRKLFPGLLLSAIMVCATGCVSVLGGAIGGFAGPAFSAALQTAPPLPPDVRIVTPGPDIPTAIAGLSGAWLGEWSPSGWTHVLVVEEITSPQKAKVVFSNGGSFLPGMEGKWSRTTARLDESGRLIVRKKGGGEIAYRRLDDKTLTVEVSGPEETFRTTLRRANLAELQKEANAK